MKRKIRLHFENVYIYIYEVCNIVDDSAPTVVSQVESSRLFFHDTKQT